MNDSTTSNNNNNNVIKEYECSYYQANNENKNELIKGKLCIGTIAISFITYESPDSTISSSIFYRMLFPFSRNNTKSNHNNKEVVLLYLPMEEISCLEKMNNNGIRCKTIHHKNNNDKIDEYFFENFSFLNNDDSNNNDTSKTRNKILQLLCDRLQLHLSKSLSFDSDEDGNDEKNSNKEQRLMLRRSLSVPVGKQYEHSNEDEMEERKRAELALAALADFSQ